DHYFSVYFTSLLNGWIAGVANQYGIIIKTTNGGTTWTNSLIPTSRMNSIKFIDENTGCVVGDEGRIYTTINAGVNWNLAVSNTTSDLQDFYMSSSGEGWAVGYDGTIIRTTNYGSNWNLESSPTTQTLYGIEGECSVGWAGIILRRNINWEVESEGFTNNLTGVDFADASNGWVVGWDGIVYHTTDGGNSWMQQNSGSTNDLLAVDFITPYAGFAVGKYGTILKAIQGGNIWIDKSITTNLHFFSVHRRFSGRAWVAGEFGNIWKTTDYGDNWVLQHQNSGYHLYSIHFVHKNYGWAAGMSGAILKTTNGGDDWIDVSPNNLEFFRSIYFIDRHIGWVVGVGGAIYSSTDDGNNWTELLPRVTYETLNKVVFVNETDGWIVGDAGTIFITTNGGSNWYQQDSPGNGYLTSAAFPETGLGWICGWDGAILHTTDGGGTIIFEVYEHNNLNLLIPDPGEVSDVIEVSISPDFLDNYSLSGVTVLIDSVIHPEVSDLAFLLTHDGITDTLIAQSEIADSNIFSCNLTDASSIPIEEGESPYEGNYKPHNPLSIFSGMDPNGDWTLKIVDMVSGNSGILQSWGLKLFFDAPTEVISEYSVIPDNFELSQNFPNPFNPSTTIRWQMPQAGFVTLKIYDV
ncbi:MAG: YCF48-related protein, partial [Ignavibacteriaceae bacterium]